MIASLLRAEYIVPAAVVLVAALTVGLYNWRWPIYGLLCYLPVSGIAILAAYGASRGERATAILAKDFVFVIPAYVGFLWSFLRSRRRFWFPGAPLLLFGLLALVVLVEALNPRLPNHLVGAIGIKIWLFYVPLFFLGYHLVDSRRQLFRLLGLMAVLAIVPAAIGLTELALSQAGKSSVVYSAYGGAASAATQGFASFQLPGGCTIRRIPSTFSFFYQYFLFASAMVAVSYAWWRGSRPAGRQIKIGGLLFLITVLAALFSGVRTALILIPLLVLAMLALGARSANRLPWGVAVAGFTAFALFGGGVGGGACGVTQHLAQATTTEAPSVYGHGVSEALSAHNSWLGLGAGADSSGARYAFPDLNLKTKFGAVQEPWYLKTYIELGILGLVVVAALLVTIFLRAFRVHRRLRDPRLKVVSAAIVALIGFVLVYNAKAQYLDLDPMNVYFWLLLGLLMKLPLLDRGEPEQEPERKADRIAVEV